MSRFVPARLLVGALGLALVASVASVGASNDTSAGTSAGTSANSSSSLPSDEWIAGFATATLIREFEISPRAVGVDAGLLRVTIDALPATAEIDTVVRSLLEVPGVESVEIVLVGSGDGSEGRPAPPIASGADADGATPSPEPAGDRRPQFLPSSKLFAPLIADPRWPRFALSAIWYLDDPELGLAGEASFGVNLPLVRFPTASRGDFELGIAGGVFSVFDFESESFDLINSDFVGGLFGSYRFGDASATLRFYHQSSHLGDEYLLRDPVERVNLSFEVLDLLLSYDIRPWLRAYGGGGLIVHREPSIDRGLLEVGTEIESPRAWLGGWLRPFAALDLQFREESDWKTDLSLAWGLELEHPRLRRTPVALVAEYYRGRSPNGQFYVRRIETIGIGAQVDF